MSLCVYIKHEKINIPLPEKLVLQSPGLQVPPSNLQRKEMDKRSKVDVMIPPRFFDSIVLVIMGKTDLPRWAAVFNTFPLFLILEPTKVPAKGNIANAIMFLGMSFLL